MRRLSCVLYLSMLAACTAGDKASSPGGQPSSTAVVAERADLRVGESRAFGGDLVVTFARVKEESRCPMDAVCVRLGEAVVALRLALSTGENDTRELSIGAPESASRAAFGRFIIQLTALTPYPRSDRIIDFAEYTATLEVASR